MTRPRGLEVLAESLRADDEVALEATGNALAIARRIEPHVARMVLDREPRPRSQTPSLSAIGQRVEGHLQGSWWV